MSASPATRSGWRSAKRTETNAPIECPTHVHALDVERVEGRGEVVGVLHEPVRRGQAVAAAATAQVGSDDPLIGKRCGDEVPVAVARRDAVHREHREARGIRSPLAARQLAAGDRRGEGRLAHRALHPPSIV